MNKFKNQIFFFRFIQKQQDLIIIIKTSPSYLSKQIGVAVDFTNVNFYEFRQIIYETDEGFLFPKTQTKTAFSLDSATFRTILYKAGKEFYIPNTLSVFQFSMNQEYADKYQRSYQSIQELIAKYRRRFKFSFHCYKIYVSVPNRWLHLL